MLTLLKAIQLNEAKQEETGESKLAVFTFGRMNPPTRGHQKLVQSVEDIAKKRGGTAFIFVSTTQDAKKNPLQYTEKVKFLSVLFPQTNIVDNAEIKNPFQAAGFLNSQGFTDLVMVVGSDRIDEFRLRFNKTDEYFDSFEIISAGERDPDAEGISGMSGTKAREAALTNNIGQFRAATGWEGDIAIAMMNAIHKGMRIE